MQVFLHRANTITYIERANKLGIGVEIDVRTHNAIARLSHDPIDAAYCDGDIDEVSLESVLLFNLRNTPILMDFKELGIVDIVRETVPHIPDILQNTICIDMFVPDMYYAHTVGLKTLTRYSRFETIQPCVGAATYHAGYWYDYISSAEDLRRHRMPLWNDTIYLVSPELHGWDLTDDFIHTAIKENYKAVCTDYPERWLEAIG